MGIFSFLATPLGWAMHWLYTVVQNYGWTIIIFTVLVRLLMFPLSLKQQKSTARMSAYQPMIQEMQKKWANDKNRQNLEMQKFYEENNIKMSAGCAPMLVNMIVLFGIIAVIQSPLNYVVQVNDTDIDTGTAIVQAVDPESNIADSSNSYTKQTVLIDKIKTNPDLFLSGAVITFVNDKPYVLAEGEYYKDGQVYDSKDKVKYETATQKPATMSADSVEKVQNFNFQFMGLNLAEAATTSKWWTFIMPVVSILTMLGSQLVVMATSGQQQGRGQMWMMTILMGVMFGFYAFRVPNGFSLYYTISNIAMTGQQLILKKIYDPKKIREEVEQEIEERRAAKKAKKKVVVKKQDGAEETLEMSEAELAKLRLAKARELDAKRYAEEAAAEKLEEEKAAAEKARKLDEERYGKGAGEKGKAEPDAEEAATAEETDEPAEAEEAAPAKAEDAKKADGEYKPGRRKRARQKKEDAPTEEKSFAEKEQEDEAKAEHSETKEEQDDA